MVLTVGRDTVYGGFSGTESDRKNKFDQGAKLSGKGADPFYGCAGTDCIYCMRVDKRKLDFCVSICTISGGRTDSGIAADGCERMSGQRQRCHGEETDGSKNINAMQGFGSMDVLCVDKTGTLTGDVILLEYYMDILDMKVNRTGFCLSEQSVSYGSVQPFGLGSSPVPKNAGTGNTF